MERKEAIEVIKNNWPDSSFTRLREALETLIPEFKVDEDERIRKDIIKTIKKESKDFPSSVIAQKANTWLAWLEKQGEQKVIIPQFRVGETIKYKECIYPYQTIEEIGNYGYKLRDCYTNTSSTVPFDKENEFELVEQKPADEADSSVKDEWIPQVGDTIRKKGTTKPLYVLCKKEGCEFSFIEERECGIAGGWLSIFALKGDYELVERPKTIEEVVNELFNPLKEAIDRQNPAWSEWDEKMLELILTDINYAQKNYHTSKLTDYNTKVNWLKSLKDRVQPQPQQQWSEEDEDIKDSIIHQLKMLRGDRNVTEGNKKEIDWLKSIRP